MLIKIIFSTILILFLISLLSILSIYSSSKNIKSRLFKFAEEGRKNIIKDLYINNIKEELCSVSEDLIKNVFKATSKEEYEKKIIEDTFYVLNDIIFDKIDINNPEKYLVDNSLEFYTELNHFIMSLNLPFILTYHNFENIKNHEILLCMVEKYNPLMNVIRNTKYMYYVKLDDYLSEDGLVFYKNNIRKVIPFDKLKNNYFIQYLNYRIFATSPDKEKDHYEYQIDKHYFLNDPKFEIFRRKLLSSILESEEFIPMSYYICSRYVGSSIQIFTYLYEENLKYNFIVFIKDESESNWHTLEQYDERQFIIDAMVYNLYTLDFKIIARKLCED